MVVPHSTGDLYHKYRPLKFQELVGREKVVSSIRRALFSPNPAKAFLLTGESGTGKTTTARIMALSLNCLGDEEEPCLECKACKSVLGKRSTDIIEVNAADHRGIGDIRNLCKDMPLVPLQLKNKVYILDEAHQLTNDAQSSLLKELEEAPKHVYIILCSTHPQKLLPTVRNRCQDFKFTNLKRKELCNFLEEVIAFEAEDINKQTISKIADASGGSPRRALVLLQQVIQLESDDPQDVSMLLSTDEVGDKGAFKLCFSLNKYNTRWSDIVEIYNDVKHLGAPSLGMMVAGYFRNQLLKADSKQKAERLAAILDLFVHPFAEGKLGENQLVLAMFKARFYASAG